MDLDADADVPPDMPELDDQLLDELALDELSLDDLADPGPLPPLVPPPPPLPEGESLPAPAPKTTTRTGATLTTPAGRFTILRRIAAGGMGEVFLARKMGSASFHKEVALKRIVTSLNRDDEARKMFLDEGRLAAHLSHPNIATVFDLVDLTSSYLLVMEYIPGNSVKELLNLALTKRASFSEGFALYVVAEIADALAYAHELVVDGKPLGVVHRDVSPHNMMVTTSGSMKLLDFGVAFSHLEGRDKTRTGIVKGKVSYMSPEQATGSEAVDGRSDQFALGIVAVELLTGRRLFDAPSKNETSTLVRIANCPPDLVATALAGLPPPLVSILSRTLSKAPGDRWPSCRAFAEALRDYLFERHVRFGPAQALAEVARLRAQPDAQAALPALPPLPTSAPPSPKAAPSPPAARPPPPPPVAVEESISISAPAVELAPPVPSAPGATTLHRKKKTQEALYSPPKARRSGVVVPIVGFVVVGLVALVAVRFLTSSSSQTAAVLEEVKTPAQQRAEKELEEKDLVAPASLPPPRLTDSPPPAPTPEADNKPVSQGVALAGAAPAGAPNGPPASSATDAPRQRQRTRAAPAATTSEPVAAPSRGSGGGTPVAEQPAPPIVATAPKLRDLSFRSTAGGSTAPSPAASGAATALGIPRGTQVPARLDGVADPNAPGPISITISKPLVIGGRTLLVQGARAVCEVGSLNGSRLSVSCDTINSGGQAHSFSGLLYGTDGRPGIPVAVSGGGSENAAASAAVSTGERVTRSLRPGGVVGELVDGVTDAVGGSARKATTPTAASASSVARGTAVSLFITQAL